MSEYQNALAEQLSKWVAGVSTHCDGTNECCPDFSCCRPHLLAHVDLREHFRDHPEDRSAMLGRFLKRFLEDHYGKGRIKVIL